MSAQPKKHVLLEGKVNFSVHKIQVQTFSKQDVTLLLNERQNYILLSYF
jgi:hypothetical protein